jgi:molecular chaperone DnaK (HSP70)
VSDVRYNTIDIERAKYSAKPIATESGDVAFNITTLVPKLATGPATPSVSGTSTPLRTGTSTPLPQADIEPEFEEQVETVTVADLTTRHLRNIKTSAQQYLGSPPQGAVYTVPTNFSHAQREELKHCSEKAGIPVLQIIHEPTAALLAYHSLQGEATHMADKKLLILDIGGVRCDSAIVAVRGGMYTILNTHHAHDFAPGELLDKAIYQHFSTEFKKKTKLDTDNDVRARMKLLLEAESVKKSLSASATANASVESLMEGMDFKSSINRIRFDMLARKIYQQIAEFALEAVQKASLEPIDIDEVLSPV